MKPKEFLHPLLLVSGADHRLVDCPRPVAFAPGPLFAEPYGWVTEAEGAMLLKRSGGPGKVYRWAYEQPKAVYERLAELEAAARVGGEAVKSADVFPAAVITSALDIADKVAAEMEAPKRRGRPPKGAA